MFNLYKTKNVEGRVQLQNIIINKTELNKILKWSDNDLHMDFSLKILQDLFNIAAYFVKTKAKLNFKYKLLNVLY